ncbi:SDR family NAD(P)-dependent oxidoreductase [Patulibacter defluvii]|uniref:SDR family NAD(P)-dependent oxidoreductase n=1 Tax=Patulibacter defluvii TaxID=3095358 RepID=UPI002A759054|nr:SDR family oxidoreductase [Patulibacter sp. DM4]
MSLPKPRPDGAALVTGASSGIGADLARELARRGHGLILVARRADRLEELAEELRQDHGVRVDVLPADLSERDGRNDLLGRIAGLGLEVDVLLNNAGYGLSGRFIELDAERQDQMIRLNVEAVHHLARAIAPGMAERKAGAILLLASVAAFQPVFGMSDYAATKAFVLSLGETLHEELKSRGVTVTTLCPGPVKTEFWEVAGGAQGAAGAKPMWTTSDKVAREAVEGLEKGARVVVPHAPVKAAALGGRYTPRSILLPLMKKTGM